MALETGPAAAAATKGTTSGPAPVSLWDAFEKVVEAVATGLVKPSESERKHIEATSITMSNGSKLRGFMLK